MGAPARAVSVQGIRKGFDGTPALDGVTLDFAAGALTTLLGPSGCGKTTLLRVVAGFLAPDSGRVLVGGEDRTETPPWQRRIGFVFQGYALWPHMSVAGNVGYGLRLRGAGRSETAGRVEAMLETVGLAGLGGRFPGQLSGGQQQRVALARALVLEPDVLLLDEPLANLDARLRVEMRREVRRLQRSLGITTLFVTHDQEEALELSDDVVVMSRGRVEQAGPAEDVFTRPAPAVAEFLGGARALVGLAGPDGSLVVEGVALPLGLPAELAGKRVRVLLGGRRFSVVSD